MLAVPGADGTDTTTCVKMLIGVMAPLSGKLTWPGRSPTEIGYPAHMAEFVRRVVVTAQDAFGHLATTYGIGFVAPTDIDTETEPSPQEPATLTPHISDHPFAARFVENTRPQPSCSRSRWNLAWTPAASVSPMRCQSVVAPPPATSRCSSAIWTRSWPPWKAKSPPKWGIPLRVAQTLIPSESRYHASGTHNLPTRYRLRAGSCGRSHGASWICAMARRATG